MLSLKTCLRILSTADGISKTYSSAFERALGLERSKGEIMKKILAVLLCSWCSCALAQTAQELIDNGKDSENVTTFGMGYHQIGRAHV